MKTSCCRCGHSIEGGSTVEATSGELRARLRGPVRLCHSCSAGLLRWLRLGDDDVISILRFPGRPGRPPLRSSHRSIDQPAIVAVAS